jgi:hypothetical protein
MTPYNPGFDVGKNFKDIPWELAQFQGYITPEYITSMAEARPDLFEGIEDPASLVTANMVDGESGQQQQGWTIDPKLMGVLSDYHMQRRGASGLEDGRTNALVDSSGGIAYADKPYSYDPAGDLQKSALEAAALAAAAFGGIGALGHGPMAGLFEGTGATTSATGVPFELGNMGAVGGTGAGGAAGTAGATGLTGGISSSLNPALIESMAGTSGYGASSAGLGGVTAGQTAINAAMNPYLNALGRLSPELASAASSLTGGIGGALGGAADYLLPASVLDKMGGGDGSTGGLGDLFGGGGEGGGSDSWLKYLLPALAGYASYKDAKKPQLQGYSGSIKPQTATQTVEQGKYGPISRTKYAAGGIAGTPRYLGSDHDGMEDGIAAHIDGEQPAALSGGEFVIPADVVSHIGNGNSNAGAKQLFEMMDRVRQARTGTAQQGKQIQPNRFMPV